MRYTLIFKMKSKTVEDMQREIAKYNLLIRRPNAYHTHHRVRQVFHFSPSRKVIALDQDQERPKYWDAFETERDVLEFVKTRRAEQLFGSLRHHGPEFTAAMAPFESEYAKVWDRYAEREFLAKCQEAMYPIFVALREATPSPRWPNVQEEWAELTRSWRRIKKHTSATSFPFVRPGVGILHAFAYDLHGDHGDLRYAVVSVQY